MGLVPGPWGLPKPETEDQKASGGDAGQEQVRLDIYLEVENMEFKYDLAFAAACYWAWSCWEGKLDDVMLKTWTRQIFSAASWNKARNPAGAVCCKLRDAGMKWPSRLEIACDHARRCV